jgi:hypothetical protein
MDPYLPHWPHDDQDVVNRLPSNHWFVQNYHRISRTPTRAELFHPYIPADILNDGPRESDPRLREVLDRIIEEAENEAIDQANQESVIAQDESLSENESTDMDIDQHTDDASIVTISDDQDDDRAIIFNASTGRAEFLQESNIAGYVYNPVSRMYEAKHKQREEHTSCTPVNGSPISTFHDVENRFNTGEGSGSGHAARLHDDVSAYQYSTPLPTQWPAIPQVSQSSDMALDPRSLTSDITPSRQPDVAMLADLAFDVEQHAQSPIAPHWEMPKPSDVGQTRALIPIVEPHNARDRVQLATAFRHEVLHDWVYDTLISNGIIDLQVTAHQLHQAEIEGAISNFGRISGQEYVLVENIIRHDWHHASNDCLYTLSLPSGRVRGTAENLEERFAGVRYAVWQYWGNRGYVRQHNVRRYLDAFPRPSFYQTILWPFPENEEWLQLWEERRVSRRA